MKNKFLAVAVAAALFMGPAAAFADSNVTASAGAHASVSPAGTTFVATGATQTFTFGADHGYSVSGVTFDGSSLGAVGSFGFTGDLTDHSINVTAQGDGGGGMIYCSGPSAPGYRVDLPGGGCGGTSIFVARGATISIPSKSKLPGAAATSFTCPDFYPSGCMVDPAKM